MSSSFRDRVTGRTKMNMKFKAGGPKIFQVCILEKTGTSTLAVKKKMHGMSDVFARLLAAGQRLLAVIKKNEGGANKDLARFADQINALCDKYEK